MIAKRATMRALISMKVFLSIDVQTTCEA